MSTLTGAVERKGLQPTSPLDLHSAAAAAPVEFGLLLILTKADNLVH